MRLLTSELLKVWTAPRTVVGLVLAELVLVAIGTASTIDSALSSGEGLPQGVGPATGTLPPHLEEDLISVSASAMLFALVLGILVVTWEYRHGTITQTFLSTPVRERVLGAKAVIAALAGAALTIPSLLLMLIIAEIWIGGHEGFHFGGHEWSLVARLALAAGIVGILGLELGALSGRQLGAIVIAFACLAFAEPALSYWSSIHDYLPAHGALDGILGTSGTAPRLGSSLLVAAAYVLALGAAAVVVTRRRDIA